MKQTEENVNSNNGINYSNLYLTLHRGSRVGGYVGVCVLSSKGPYAKRAQYRANNTICST